MKGKCQKTGKNLKQLSCLKINLTYFVTNNNVLTVFCRSEYSKCLLLARIQAWRRQCRWSMSFPFQITMPSGTYVTAGYSCYSPDDCFLDVAVYPLTEDFGHSEGLCGNYNDNMDDDLIARGSNRTGLSSSEPVEFTNSYMYLFIYLFIYSFIHSFIHLVRLFIYLFISLVI